MLKKGRLVGSLMAVLGKWPQIKGMKCVETRRVYCSNYLFSIITRVDFMYDENCHTRGQAGVVKIEIFARLEIQGQKCFY